MRYSNMGGAFVAAAFFAPDERLFFCQLIRARGGGYNFVSFTVRKLSKSSLSVCFARLVGRQRAVRLVHTTYGRLHEWKLFHSPLARLAYTSLRSVCMSGSYSTRRSRDWRIRRFAPFA